MEKAISKVALFFFLTSLTFIGRGQIALYNFQDIDSASGVNANITASIVTISSGNINFQNGTDDGGTRIGNSGTWNTGNFATSGKYLQFTISPNSGYQIDFTEIRLRHGRTAAGPQQVTVQYSLDGFSTAGTTILSNGSITSIDENSLNSFSITSSLPTSVTGTLTVRIWGHNASGTGNFRFNNFRIFGTVSSTSSNTITTGLVTGAPFSLPNCAATTSGTVAFTSTGTFTAGNIYTAQLSNELGSFASPTNIGTLNSTGNTGSINITIPAGTVSGTAYKIRVISSAPVTTGTESANFSINQSGTCASAATDYFRSRATGNWTNVNTWESSNDNATWINATLTPTSTANTITVRNGHTVTISSNLTVDQLVVASGGQIDWTGGTLTLNNGAGDDIDIYGVFNNNVTGEQISPPAGATVRIRTGGILRVSTAVGSISQNYAAVPSSGRFIWENGAIFDWNVNSSFSASGQTYFPDAGAGVIPIFRISSAIGGSLGGGSNFGVNGIFEVNGNIAFQGDGNLNIRNGFIGTGDFTKTTGTGNVLFNGSDTALLGGSGTLTLGASLRIATDGASVSKLISNKTINGGQLRITNPGTLFAQGFEISGTAGFRMNERATFVTSHPNGIDGSIGSLTGTKSYENNGAPDNEREQTFVFNRNGAQNAGTLPTTCGKIRIENSSQLNLQSDLEIEGLTGGGVEVSGAGSVLGASSARTLTIKGNREILLESGGTMDDNCLTNLSLVFTGNSSTGVLTGNGETVKCFNFTSTKSTSGGLTFTTNTPFRAGNNFRVDFSGGSAVLTDNGNTLTYGDDLRLTGATSNYNLTGTLRLLASGGSNDFENVEGEINNLIIETSGDARPRFRDNAAYTQNITIKGNLTYTTTSSRALFLNDANITVRGNISNSAPSNRFEKGTSTFILDGTANQTLTGLNDFYNLTINKASGNTILANNTQASNTLTMSQGDILTGANTLEIGASTTNKGTLSRTSGFVVGTVKRWFDGTNSGAASSLFPFGVGSERKFISVEYTTAPSSGGSLTASLIENDMEDAGLPIAVAATGTCPAFNVLTASKQAFWEVNDADGLTGGIYTFTIEAEGFQLINEICQLALLKRVGASNWSLAGTHIEPSGTPSLPIVSATGVSGFSNFGLGGGPLSPLPVTFGNIEATLIYLNTVRIDWSTTSETNNSHFEVQRSTNSNEFETIAILSGAGNSFEENHYEYFDHNLNTGLYYYRINQVDFDGKSSHSRSIPVMISESPNWNKTLKSYPNPVQNKVTLSGLNMGNYKFEVFSSLGVSVWVNQLNLKTNEITLDLGRLPSGIYIIKVWNSKTTQISKVVKE